MLPSSSVYSLVAYRKEADSLGGGELTAAEREASNALGWPLGGTMQTVPAMPVHKFGPVRWCYHHHWQKRGRRTNFMLSYYAEEPLLCRSVTQPVTVAVLASTGGGIRCG